MPRSPICTNEVNTVSSTEPCTPSTSTFLSVAVDHAYIVKDSPRSLKRKMDSVVDRAMLTRKKLKYSHAKVRRLKRKVKSLSDIVADLKKKDIISTGCESVLQSTFSGVSLEIMKRLMNQKSTKLTRSKYPEELKSFALTLSFYSSKAYNYVRRTFSLALPLHLLFANGIVVSMGCQVSLRRRLPHCLFV